MMLCLSYWYFINLAPSVCKIVIIVIIMFRWGGSRVKAKLVCALLLEYWYRTVGYDLCVLCVLLCEVLELDRLGQYRIEKYWH